jgi:hypothetical protein
MVEDNATNREAIDGSDRIQHAAQRIHRTTCNARRPERTRRGAVRTAPRWLVGFANIAPSATAHPVRNATGPCRTAANRSVLRCLVALAGDFSDQSVSL